MLTLVTPDGAFRKRKLLKMFLKTRYAWFAGIACRLSQLRLVALFENVELLQVILKTRYAWRADVACRLSQLRLVALFEIVSHMRVLRKIRYANRPSIIGLDLVFIDKPINKGR